MRYFKICLLLFVAAVLQCTLLARLTFFSTQIDLLLIIVISFSLLNGSKTGMTIGFFAGLIQDILIGRFIGIHAVSRMLVGYLIGFLEHKVFKENLIVPFLTTFAATIISEFIIWFIGLFLFWHYSFLNAVRQLVLTAALINAILAPFVYNRIYKAKL
ncbi:MAG TPA: rod shape-determining protein MreD [Clostridia bacterium]|jgi:rod shape-determining protein MreD|nr:rod shape-determining protein MreD [Clostridia bacterium]